MDYGIPRGCYITCDACYLEVLNLVEICGDYCEITSPPTCIEAILSGIISLEGWWIVLSVIDVGEISCTGCRSNHKKNFQNNLFKPNTRTEVFFPAVCTLIRMLK